MMASLRYSLTSTTTVEPSLRGQLPQSVCLRESLPPNLALACVELAKGRIAPFNLYAASPCVLRVVCVFGTANQ